MEQLTRTTAQTVEQSYIERWLMDDNYWKESLQEVFDDHGIRLTDEIANDIILIAEMESEATGSINIPNTLTSEVDGLKNTIRKLEACHDKQLCGIMKGVAERRNVDVSDVHIDSEGYVTYDP